MSKQSIAKTNQGYVEKNTKICSSCRFFALDLIKEVTRFKTWTEEKNLRCTLGGFAVKKMATCNKFEGKKNV